MLPGRTPDLAVLLVAGIRSTARWWFMRIGVLPVTRRARFFTGHNVVDLIAVDGLEFHQGSGHQMQLVEIVLEDLLRTRIGLVNNGTDFTVDIVRRLV